MPPATALDQCVHTGSPEYCDLITRDSQGTLWLLPEAQIVATNVNIGETKTSGWDIGVNYALAMNDWGTLNFAFMGTILDEFILTPLPGVEEYDCAGLYGQSNCGTPLPELRTRLRTTWATPWNVDLSLNWRFFDGVTSTPPRRIRTWPIRRWCSRAWTRTRRAELLRHRGGLHLRREVHVERGYQQRHGREPAAQRPGRCAVSATATPIRRCTTRWAATCSSDSRRSSDRLKFHGDVVLDGGLRPAVFFCARETWPTHCGLTSSVSPAVMRGEPSRSRTSRLALHLSRTPRSKPRCSGSQRCCARTRRSHSARRPRSWPPSRATRQRPCSSAWRSANLATCRARSRSWSRWPVASRVPPPCSTSAAWR